VLGEVERPGTYLATPVKRVSEVIDQAGGVLPGGSQRYIQIRRDGKISETADLLRFLKQGDESMNPFLKDGDVIFVPPMGDQRVVVQVSEVSTGGPTGTTGGAGGGGAATESAVPSIIEIKPGERLSSVISELGGTNPWWDLESVTIQRASESPEGTMRIPVDLRRFFYENDQSQNPVLQGGDEIYIPALIKRVFVAGEVKLPGAYSYIPGRSADAYVMQAGGPAPFADLSRSFIMRADGTALRYDGSVEMNSGDSIVVLEMMFKTFQDYFALVGTLTGVVVSMVGFYAIFTNFGR
jgi:protein involved in polysaccharide export with SLBB domain